jgi:hypothetical protein
MLSTLILLMSALPPADDAAVPPVQAPALVEPAAPVATAQAVSKVRTNDLIQLIAREAISQQELDKAAVRPDVAGALSAHPNSDKYAVFAVKFAQARTPSCLGGDGLKFNPPVIAEIPGFGPIMASGIYAIPWLVAAKLKGKCN